MKILFVLPHLGYSGAGKQLTHLAAGLPRHRYDVRVAVLGHDGPLGEPLRAAGVEIEILGWTRLVDVRSLTRFRRLVRHFQPDILHAWGSRALVTAALAGGVGRTVLSVRSLAARRDGPGRADRWLLQSVDRIVVPEGATARVYEHLGVPAEQICAIPPGVAPALSVAVDRRALLGTLGLPETARLLVGVGPFVAGRGHRDAAWALDILKYVFADLHLVLVGEGPERDQLLDFARGLQVEDRLHFVGRQPDVTAWLAQAEVVWVPGRGGTNTALEAMAAGRPVVAARVPGPADVVHDGTTGCLIDLGDKVGLARQTRRLLDDDGLRRSLGDAGRQRAAEHFAAADLVHRHAGLYETIGSNPPTFGLWPRLFTSRPASRLPQ